MPRFQNMAVLTPSNALANIVQFLCVAFHRQGYPSMPCPSPREFTPDLQLLFPDKAFTGETNDQVNQIWK